MSVSEGMAAKVAQAAAAKVAEGAPPPSAETAAYDVMHRAMEADDVTSFQPGKRTEAKRRKAKARDQSETDATTVARALERARGKELAEYREDLLERQRTGDPNPTGPRPSRVLALLTDVPDPTEPYYRNGDPVEIPAGYVHRYVRKASDFGGESAQRMRQFQAYGYSTIPDPDGGVVENEFGVLMIAPAERAGARMLQKAPQGALRSRKDKIELAHSMVDAINSNAGTEVLRVYQGKDHEKRQERVPVDTEYPVE